MQAGTDATALGSEDMVWLPTTRANKVIVFNSSDPYYQENGQHKWVGQGVGAGLVGC